MSKGKHSPWTLCRDSTFSGEKYELSAVLGARGPLSHLRRVNRKRCCLWCRFHRRISPFDGGECACWLPTASITNKRPCAATTTAAASASVAYRDMHDLQSCRELCDRPSQSDHVIGVCGLKRLCRRSWDTRQVQFSRWISGGPYWVICPGSESIVWAGGSLRARQKCSGYVVVGGKAPFFPRTSHPITTTL